MSIIRQAAALALLLAAAAQLALAEQMYPPSPDKWDVLRGPLAEPPIGRYSIVIAVPLLETAISSAEPLALEEGCRLKKAGVSGEKNKGRVKTCILYKCELARAAAGMLAEKLEAAEIGQRTNLITTPPTFETKLARAEQLLAPLKSEYLDNQGLFKKLPIAASLMEGKLDQVKTLREKSKKDLTDDMVLLELTLCSKEPPPAEY